MDKDYKKLEIVIRAEELQDWVFRVTSKKARPPEDFKPGENNGLPAKYQQSIGVRMQNYTLDFMEYLDDIQYDKSNRLELLTSLLHTLRHLNSCIWLCFRQNIISKSSAEYGETLLLNVKRMALAWRQKLM